MPNNDKAGMLEMLCLDSINNNNQVCYIEMQKYIECLDNHYKGNTSFNIHKAQTQIYLASKILIVNSLGIGALKGYWDFDNEVFKDIKDFLTALFL